MNKHFTRPHFLICLLAGCIGLGGYGMRTTAALAEVTEQPQIPASVGNSPVQTRPVSPTQTVLDEAKTPGQAGEVPSSTVVTPNTNPAVSNTPDINAVGGVGEIDDVAPKTASPGGANILSNPRLFKILKDNPQLIEILRNNPQLIEILLKNPSLIPK